MGVFTNKIKRSEIETGDHIYSYRPAFTYSHHGIYVGNEKVVHFTSNSNKSWSSSSFPRAASCSSMSKTPLPCTAFPDCGFEKPGSGVVLSCLDCFMQSGSLYRFEYGKRWYAFCAKVRGGTCTTAMSDEPDLVIHRAMYLLHNGFGKYDVLHNNCEDFALYCKTGLLIVTTTGVGRSGQVIAALDAFTSSVVTPYFLKLFLPTPVVAPLTVVDYCMSRYRNDIGVRRDVVKVNVENLDLAYMALKECQNLKIVNQILQEFGRFM